VPYLRLTADRRGFENTFLLHVAAPGEAPRVLYWYRTAPGLRIGRPALDDAAMRMLEAQYPDIDFDWPYILDMGTMTPVEVEGPVPPRRRKPRRAESEEDADAASEPPAALDDELPPPADFGRELPRAQDSPPLAAGPDLLADLLGRGIASSLRVRHQQLRAECEARAWPDEAARAVVEARLAAIDPDGWLTADAVLGGMARIDGEVEALRRALEDRRAEL
jgi:hypothetical protein